MRRQEEHVLEMQDYAAGGKSLAKVDGRVVFVPWTVPGDRVRARITKVRKGYAEAALLDLLEASSRRIDPPCRFFGSCGGCKWQQAPYGEQLAFKRRQVIDAMMRIGGFEEPDVKETIGSKEEYFYRNKMEFSFGARWLEEKEHRKDRESGGDAEGAIALGLHPSGTYFKVIDIDRCWLQSETSNRILAGVRRFTRERRLTYYSTRTHTGFLRNVVIREGRQTGDLMLNIVTSEHRADLMHDLTGKILEEVPEITTVVNNVTGRKSQVAVGETERVYHGPGHITERLGNKVFRISANSFFQTNTEQAEQLYSVVQRVADLRQSDVVYDLYCGTGSIALFLSDGVCRVVGVETVEAAVLDARNNAGLNSVSNCTFVAGDLKDMLTRQADWMAAAGRPDVVVVDPPRSGLHPAAAAALPLLGARTIVYVSCNPATQARDLRILCAGGTYGIGCIQPVDMFPHTDHIECVVALNVR